MTKDELKQKCRDLETAAFNMCLMFARGDLGVKTSGYATLEHALKSTILEAAQRRERMLREWEKNNPE